MTLYHLHARRFTGRTLSDPDAEYLFESRDTDELPEAQRAATELAARGFEAVIYDHGHTPLVSGACDYRQIEKHYPDGRVDRTPDPPT